MTSAVESIPYYLLFATCHPNSLKPSLFVALATIMIMISILMAPNELKSTLPVCLAGSSVCRYWRGVALDCPTLWAYHFVVSLRWTEELLARSQQTSLKIRIQHKHA
ncbi:hypothetical protein OG21DRAFT_1505103 [Imleria badia]|nr:hypothetical protein OG21DRAFT_1505103 [Imleria badia]